MIKYIEGDLLSVTQGVIIHGCNAQGVMGSGVALAIKNKYYGAFQLYNDHHRYVPGGLKLGDIVWAMPETGLWIANAVTQDNFGRTGQRYVNYCAVAEVFKKAVDRCRELNCSLNFPAIGAGLGGGDWAIIEELINDADPNDSVEKVCYLYSPNKS